MQAITRNLRARVLVRSDAPDFVERIKTTLNPDSFRVYVARTLEELEGQLDESIFHAVILHVDDPDYLGQLRSLFNHSSRTPTLLVTEKTFDPGMIVAVAMGAQDVINLERSDKYDIELRVRFAIERHRLRLEGTTVDSEILQERRNGNVIDLQRATMRLRDATAGFEQATISGMIKHV